jgi:hypothetical protein
MYRCLTEFPSRTPGCLVPLSTLTFELDGGLLWRLPPVPAASLADGPYTEVNVYRPDGSSSTISTRERQQYINELAGYIANLTASGPFWPGDNLIEPSTDPLVMPYKPYRS